MDDNRLISENADGITVAYTYDDLGKDRGRFRVLSKKTQLRPLSFGVVVEIGQIENYYDSWTLYFAVTVA